MENQLQLGIVSYKKDNFIVVEGKQNTGVFFIIQQGKVQISKEAEVEGEGNEVLGPGDFIGVVSTMSNHSHIETAMALSDVVLIRVQQHQYVGLIQKNAAVAMKMIINFSRRLRLLNETLAKIALKKAAEEGPSHLFSVAEYYLGKKEYEKAYYAYTQYIEYCPSGENVTAAGNKLAEIAPLIKNVRTEFGPEEFNRVYQKNTMLFAEGEPGNELFIIHKGSVKITKIVDNNEVLLAILKAGDIFGEMALLESKPRAASAVAHEDCTVMAVNKANFEKMITNQPQLIAKVTTLLADRIWLIYKQLANAQILDPICRLYYAMLIQLEKNRIALDEKEPHTFNFGWPELLSMAGVPGERSEELLGVIMKSRKIQFKDNKIHVFSVEEIAKETEYHRKMELREKARQENREQLTVNN